MQYIYIANCINHSFNTGIFPSELKAADIVPIFKNGDNTDIKSFRPISLLPCISKVFETVIFKQLNAFFAKIFSPLLCGFRKYHSTQHALFRLVNHWQNSLDDSQIVGTVLMDLSKAYDTLPHDLLIAKLSAYGVSKASLKLLLSYLTNRMHRVKLDNEFSGWLGVSLGVPQGSILGPILFNIFINDLFYITLNPASNICNFADDNSLYTAGNTIRDVINQLDSDTEAIQTWFKINCLCANPKKFQAMFLGCSADCIPRKVTLGRIEISPTSSVKLLGIHIDNKLSFKLQIETMCSKASQKINALLRIRSNMTLHSAKLLSDAYILSAFKYCPLIWMFHDKSMEVLINKTQCRMLRAIYQNFSTSFTNLLLLDKSSKIHKDNLHLLMIEVYKSQIGLSPKFMSEIFQIKQNKYQLRSGSLMKLKTNRSKKHGVYSVQFRGSLLWNRLPNYIKSARELHEFKIRIKKWQGLGCECRICV